MENNIETINLCGKSARRMHISANKPTMLFVPGALQDIESIKTLNTGFSEHFNYHIAELPGSGLAGPLHSSYPVEFLGDCLKQYIDTYIQGPFHLVSCSYATGLAVEYAKQHSYRLSTLTLAGAMQEIPKSAWPTVLGLMADCLHQPDTFARNFVNLLTSQLADIPKLDIIKKATLRKTRKYTDQEFWTFIYNTIRLMSYRATDLHSISCPSLCFTGEHDPFVTPEECAALAHKIPGCQFTLLPDTDHLFHIEKPKATVELIQKFILNRTQIAA